MLFRLISFLRFFWYSTNHHKIHSPFVFELVTNCFYNNKQQYWYADYLKLRNELLKDKTIIEVTDFGAGSKKMDRTTRSVQSIAKNAGINLKRAFLLGRMTDYLQTGNILEIGTSAGLGAAAVSMGNTQNKIFTLEGCPNTATIAKKYFEKYRLRNIHLIEGNFDSTLPRILKEHPFDMIFFDGNHRKEPTISYFEQCLKYVKNDSVFIFDDIYWSKGMNEAWNYIYSHPAVSVSIDTYRWGIVFFRKEQPKQHFIIRI